ncbi:MAG: hypothetical protein QNJ05_04005 [Woeseiaceae bacterium]|nr:hypothetical protein [Woeseiaceae bacterium]
MPYRQAHYFIALTFLVIVIGFWGSYFQPFNSVPLAFHVHAVTAMAWVLLLLFQHWSIHNRKRQLHRTAGLLSLVLFPFLITGFVMIVNTSAVAFIESEERGAFSLGPSFGLSMLFAIIAYLVLYYRALRHKRNVFLHSGYMLTTALVLFESPFSRIMLKYLPFMIFTGSEFPLRILDAIAISMGLSIAFAVAMYVRDRKHATPFLVAAGLMTMQAISMLAGAHSEWVRDAFRLYAAIPDGVTIVAGFLLGAIVSWVGFRHSRAGPTVTPATVSG